jgi:competence protein ComEC
MTKSRVFLFLSLSFILGVFSRSFFDVNFAALKYFFSISAIIIFAAFFKNKTALATAGALIFFILGVWRTEIGLNQIKNLPPGGPFSGAAIVAKEPEQKENYQQVIIRENNGSKLLLNTSQYSALNYGDKLKVDCDLEMPKSEGEFDYKMYLAKDKVYYLCRNPQYEKIQEGAGSKFYGILLNLRKIIEKNIRSVLPQPESALGSGLILGGSSRMSKEVQNNFSKISMTHIVAVSGYNVTIIAEYLMILGIFLGLWRPRAFWFAIIGIFLFVLAIGFPSSAVRAAVMGGLLLWAAKNGRLAKSYNAIVFAGAAMLIINPLLLRWDIGFQLSFLAALGIVLLSPLWERKFAKKHRAFGITEIAFLTVSAQIFVLPIALFNFHNFSYVSILANVLILPVVPLTMFLVFFSAIFGVVWHPLSLALGWLAYLPLHFIIWVADLMAGLEWANRTVKNFSPFHVVLWYALLFLAVFYVKTKMEKRRKYLMNKLTSAPERSGVK